MRFYNFPVTIDDTIRDGLVCITENGTTEALLDVGKGAPVANVLRDAHWLSNQRHRPKIAIKCNDATAARLLTPQEPQNER